MVAQAQTKTGPALERETGVVKLSMVSVAQRRSPVNDARHAAVAVARWRLAGKINLGTPEEQRQVAMWDAQDRQDAAMARAGQFLATRNQDATR